MLLHRLEQRRLRLGRRAVDFVGEHDVGEDRPGANTMPRRPVLGSSWMMSVPVMSEGIRSGVNWMRLNESSSTCASVAISSVLARPGTPTMRQLPPTNRRCRTSSMTSRLADDPLLQLGDDRLPPGIHPVRERDIID